MKHKIYLILFAGIGYVLLATQHVLAQGATPVPPAPDLATLATALSVSAKILRATAYGIGVAMVIYAGILYLTSYGDENKPTQAKNIIKGVAIGLLFVILAEVIVLALLKGVSEDATGQRNAIEEILQD